MRRDGAWAVRGHGLGTALTLFGHCLDTVACSYLSHQHFYDEVLALVGRDEHLSRGDVM